MKPMEMGTELVRLKNFLPHGIELRDLDPQGLEVYALPVYGSDGMATPSQYVSYLMKRPKVKGEDYSYFGFSYSMDCSFQDFRRYFFEAVHDFQEALNGS